MNKHLLILAASIVSMIPLGLSPCAAQNRDEIEIRGVMKNLDDAWNRHDMKAFASQFAEDADQVNVAGWWWKGRGEIEKKLTAAHSYIFRESTHSDDEVHIKFLTPEIAVVHVLWSIVGDKHIDGSPAGTSAQPRKGIQTQVLQKRSGKWLIVAFHNTNRIPERPLSARTTGELIVAALACAVSPFDGVANFS